MHSVIMQQSSDYETHCRRGAKLPQYAPISTAASVVIAKQGGALTQLHLPLELERKNEAIKKSGREVPNGTTFASLCHILLYAKLQDGEFV